MERTAKKGARRQETSRLKAALRRRLRATRPLRSRDRRSAALRRRLAAWPVFRAARVIAAYRSRPDEPCLEPLLRDATRRGCRVCVPAATRQGYGWAWWTPDTPERRGPHGIMEPRRPRRAPAGRVDLALVPGLAFDAVGRRLGRGGGHFDRLLTRTAGLRVGVAFEEQKLRRIPAAAHDVKMDFVITERKLHVMKRTTNRAGRTRRGRAGRSEP